MNIRYCGPALDYSGYGEANRHDIGALAKADIGVTVELTKHCLEIAEFGALGEMIRDMTNRPLEYKIKILHTTPNIYGQFIEPGKYHIGRVFWETDKLPPDFVRGIEMVDEIWTGSQSNADAIRNSGINKPIYIIPEAIDSEIGNLDPYVVPRMDEYQFYSIFEWIERKNPAALLEAFWREFESTPGVVLVIKTYIDNFTPDKRIIIDDYIAQMKRRVPLTSYAPVYLYRKLMNRQQMYRFHRTFNCFVSAHRGEGWGIPQMEALLVGNPVISTNYGGIHEYLKDKESAYLLPYDLIFLTNVTRNKQWYCDDQKWADVKIEDLRKAMRYVFEHQDEAKVTGAIGHAIVEREFSFESVGRKMRERLEAIQL